MTFSCGFASNVLSSGKLTGHRPSVAWILAFGPVDYKLARAYELMPMAGLLAVSMIVSSLTGNEYVGTSRDDWTYVLHGFFKFAEKSTAFHQIARRAARYCAVHGS